MNYQVLLMRSAERDMRKLPADAYARVLDALKSLAENPRPPGVRKLRDRPGWRIRVVDYRAIYVIDDGGRKVSVVNVGDRKDIYD